MRAEFSSKTTGNEIEIVAAADLGSNSFHLVLGRLESGRLVVVDRIRDIVRLGGGLDTNSNLTPVAQRRALECLQRFGQRLRDVPAQNIRAVGTNTFRKARNIKYFLPEAEKALGHVIEVISGREEARLIYESVSYGLSEQSEKRLVIDIGGGSTEVIAGSGYTPDIVDSLYIGCVSLTSERFPNGRINHYRMARAEQSAQLEVRAIRHKYVRHGWTRVLGCSGTIRAVGDVLQNLGWGNGNIEREALGRLRKKIVQCKHTTELVDLGFDSTRCEVLPGGFAIVSALFELLDIEYMEVSELALREGVMYDLLGRLRNDDARQRTVQSLIEHWSIDMDHARRVQSTALDIYDQIADSWFSNRADARNLLGWGALLHEIGLSIAHPKYHEHGAYLLEHSDLAGFSRSEQAALATLVRWHRRKMPPNQLGPTTHLPTKVIKRLCVILRLAVLLHRPRTDRVDLKIGCSAKKKRINLGIRHNWLNQHPLTRADLVHEKQNLQEAGIDLRVVSELQEQVG